MEYCERWTRCGIFVASWRSIVWWAENTVLRSSAPWFLPFLVCLVLKLWSFFFLVVKMLEIFIANMSPVIIIIKSFYLQFFSFESWSQCTLVYLVVLLYFLSIRFFYLETIDGLSSNFEIRFKSAHTSYLDSGMLTDISLSNIFDLYAHIYICFYSEFCSDSINRAVSGFEEVKLVMQRSNSSISRRLYAFQCSVEAIEFLKYVPEVWISLKYSRCSQV